MSDPYCDAMRQAGWTYDHQSNGWSKTIHGTAHWVGWDQAQRAWAAAQAGEHVQQPAMSKTLATIVANAANDG